MTPNPRNLSIALIATAAALVVPASAMAEYLVPEGNSAVTQYTEGFPTAGGERKTEGNKKTFTAAEAIGAGNARKLEEHGSDGEAVAEIAAETAPEAVTSGGSDGGGQDRPGQGGGDDRGQGQPAKDGSGSQQDQSGAGGAASDGEGPSGSSGLGEIIGAATGSSSSGGIGLLLPLTILAAIAWGLAHLWRARRHLDLAASDKP